jgi:DMSO/TMAO reductase YedYZ molybdopterin-dependent catalytic subunit
MDEPNKRLIAKKEEWAKTKRGLSVEEGVIPDHRPRGNRLPPGQHLAKGWPVLDLGVHPTIAPDEWRLSVHGEVDHPFVWILARLSRTTTGARTCRTFIASRHGARSTMPGKA